MSGPRRSESDAEGDQVDDLFLLLADDRRRSVLHYFRSSETEVATVAELIEYTAQTRTGADCEQLEVRFHHATLPRLAEANIIDYDTRSRTVTYRGNPLAEKWFDLISQIEVAP